MDWLTIVPYLLLSFILLICIGLYGLLTGKQFIQIIFGVVLVFTAVNILLLTLTFTKTTGDATLDPLTQVFSIFIIVVSFVLFIVGLTLERRMRQTGVSTIMEFNFELEEGLPSPEQGILVQSEVFLEEASSQKGGKKQ